jgi:hypothetical protein
MRLTRFALPCLIVIPMFWDIFTPKSHHFPCFAQTLHSHLTVAFLFYSCLCQFTSSSSSYDIIVSFIANPFSKSSIHKSIIKFYQMTLALLTMLPHTLQLSHVLTFHYHQKLYYQHFFMFYHHNFTFHIIVSCTHSSTYTINCDLAKKSFRSKRQKKTTKKRRKP